MIAFNSNGIVVSGLSGPEDFRVLTLTVEIYYF